MNKNGKSKNSGWKISLKISSKDEKEPNFSAEETFTPENCELDKELVKDLWSAARDHVVDHTFQEAIAYQDKLNSEDKLYKHNDYRDLIQQMYHVLCDSNVNEEAVVKIGSFQFEMTKITEE